MPKITVYHPQIPINAGHTEFNGYDVGFLVEDDGTLKVLGWETHTERGDATFASGQWAYVCRSDKKVS